MVIIDESAVASINIPFWLTNWRFETAFSFWPGGRKTLGVEPLDLPVSERYQLDLNHSSLEKPTTKQIMGDYNTALREKDEYAMKTFAGAALAITSVVCFSGFSVVGIVVGSVFATNSYNLYMKKTKDAKELSESSWVKFGE